MGSILDFVRRAFLGAPAPPVWRTIPRDPPAEQSNDTLMALRSALRGFGVPFDGFALERLVGDGNLASIDHIEAALNQHGIHAVQIMAPAEHVLLEGLAPSIAVGVGTPTTVFRLVWRGDRSGARILSSEGQPAWLDAESFRRSLYVHEMDVPRTQAEEWITGGQFCTALGQRIELLGASTADARARVEAAARGGAAHVASLDAATRALERAHPRSAMPLLHEVFAADLSGDRRISDELRFVRSSSVDGMLTMRGAVLITLEQGRCRYEDPARS